MKIRWCGHSCFEIITSKGTILTDPHDGMSIGIKPPMSDADIVTVSHDHYDHNAVRMVQRQHKDLLYQLGETDINGIIFNGYPSFHDEENGNLRGTNVIYTIEVDGLKLCHLGDLGDTPSDEVLEAISDSDIFFVPIGETYTLTQEKSLAMFEKIEPPIIIPMHYRVGGLTIPLLNIDDFIEKLPEDCVVYVGNEVELEKEDVEEFRGCLVFDL